MDDSSLPDPVPERQPVSRHPRRRPGHSSSRRCGRSAWTPTPVTHAHTGRERRKNGHHHPATDLTGPALSGMTEEQWDATQEGFVP